MQGFATRLSLTTLVLALAVPLQAAPLRTLGKATKAQPVKISAVKADEKTANKIGKAGGQKAGGQKAGGQKAGAKAPVAGGPNDEKALWWNDAGLQKALSLNAEQREKMAEYLAAYRAKVPPLARPEAFHETLVQSDWKRAGRENDKLADGAEKSIRMRGRLKIDVLSVLTKEQHKILIDRLPRLIYKPWTRAMRGAAPR